MGDPHEQKSYGTQSDFAQDYPSPYQAEHTESIESPLRQSMQLGDEPLGCAWDWGPHGGHLCGDVCDLSPCCGDPCNTGDAAYCCVMTSCCYFCMKSKLYSYSMDQECACVNHCLLPSLISILFPCFMNTTIRSNLRQMHGIGKQGCQCGDCLACLFCCCTECQHLRSVPKEGWDFFGGNIHCCSEPVLFARPPVMVVV
mmetsp:Transcript_8522/g.11506  ORF Transcript_8522/g.11506 Transcript_8522/m.11506 type:complete len:199 (+) Transcript_8522:35-631(+)